MPSPRLAGTLGAVYVKISGVFTKVADVYDWEWHVGTELRDCSIKGDAIERWIPSHAVGVTFTAKRRYEGIQVWPAFVSDSATNATQTIWRLDLINNNNAFTQIIGNGYAKTSSITVPQEGVDETFELQFDDSYTINV